uniref:HTH CENPB-type domain-containing protein n=1 Tax=Hyaloperonospora arabidopsidis (strain Emoy2) TaxID=559515 RepID=M4BS35_HYAAE
MQRVGLHVARIAIMNRATLICDALQKRTKAIQSTQLASGWYSHFLGHHPVLVPRTAQSIGRVKNAIGMSSVNVLILNDVQAAH